MAWRFTKQDSEVLEAGARLKQPVANLDCPSHTVSGRNFHGLRDIASQAISLQAITYLPDRPSNYEHFHNPRLSGTRRIHLDLMMLCSLHLLNLPFTKVLIQAECCENTPKRKAFQFLGSPIS